MRYEIRAVDEWELPSGTDWAFARVPEGVFLFVKRSRLACPDAAASTLTDAWTSLRLTERTTGPAPHLLAV